MKFIKKLFSKIFYKIYFILFDCRFLNYEIIEIKLNKLKIKRCKSQVIMGENSQFYEEASIYNFQNDRKQINIGDNSHIRGELLIFANGGKIDIGCNCYIGKSTNIWSASSIKIGDEVLISHNCNIIDTNSHELDFFERAENYKKMIKFGHPKEKTNVETKAIIIEDYAWISFNVTILKGVTIGKGAIIAAGAVVTKNVESFTMVAGNPAKFVKKLE